MSKKEKKVITRESLISAFGYKLGNKPIPNNLSKSQFLMTSIMMSQYLYANDKLWEMTDEQFDDYLSLYELYKQGKLTRDIEIVEKLNS